LVDGKWPQLYAKRNDRLVWHLNSLMCAIADVSKRAGYHREAARKRIIAGKSRKSRSLTSLEAITDDKVSA